jgi:glycerol-3-phosphate dehydrogenase
VPKARDLSPATSMRRDLTRLADTTFDVLVIGAGIQGACVAWDAALRGLSVAVVDQDDFGAATSANSLGIVHGGLRYLSRADFRRMLESAAERSALLRIAPGLVEPLPVLVPLYRDGALTGSRIAHLLALAANDLVSGAHNGDLETDRVIPTGRLVSQDECLRLFPDFPAEGVNGGALWHDARLRHAERLTLSFLLSAARQGAVAANYLRAERLRFRHGAVQGAWLVDLREGARLEIRSRSVIVAAGPWTPGVIASSLPENSRDAPTRRVLAVNAILSRRLAGVAVGVKVKGETSADRVWDGPRFLFCVPQGETTAIGTWYTVAQPGDQAAACERGIQSLVRELNRACPGLELSNGDVVRAQSGWLPLQNDMTPGHRTTLAQRPRIVDHGREDGIRSLFSVEGVKYTTARRVAERVVDRLMVSLGRNGPPSRTAEVRLLGAATRTLPGADGRVSGEQITHTIRDEMALRLSDIVFRRTSLGMPPGPGRAMVEEVARVAAAELGWTPDRKEAEVEDVMRQAGASPLQEVR